MSTGDLANKIGRLLTETGVVRTPMLPSLVDRIMALVYAEAEEEFAEYEATHGLAPLAPSVQAERKMCESVLDKTGMRHKIRACANPLSCTDPEHWEARPVESTDLPVDFVKSLPITVPDEPDIDYAYRLPLEEMRDGVPPQFGGRVNQDAAMVFVPRDHWEKMGRPGWISVQVSPSTALPGMQ